MLNLVFTVLVGSSVAALGSPCDYKADPRGHLEDVCSPHLDGAEAYSITMRASLNPEPASRQVMVYRLNGKWFLRFSGFRWEPGATLVETRRNEVEIDDEDARSLVALMNDAKLQKLSRQPYYGSADVICTDGAEFELARARDGLRLSARQHSCAGKTELNATAAEFRRLAVKYDPKAEGMLGPFRN